MFFRNQQCIFGSLCVVSADNHGSLALGGFIESFSAHRYCRHCMATNDEAKTKVCGFFLMQFSVHGKPQGLGKLEAVSHCIWLVI